MAPGRSALFVIDIQHEMCGDPKTEIPHATRIKEAGQQILDAARAHIAKSQKSGSDSDLEVIFVQHNELSEGGTLVLNSPAWQLFFTPDTNSDKPEPVIRKTDCDTFESNPTLAQDLKSRGVDRLVVCGLQSEHCVQATSKGALKAGFQVTLLQGAHSTYDDDGQTAAQIEQKIEAELKDLGAVVVPWRKWCDELGGDASA